MVFYKSLGQAFSKACGVLGQCPKVFDKFIFNLKNHSKLFSLNGFLLKVLFDFYAKSAISRISFSVFSQPRHGSVMDFP